MELCGKNWVGIMRDDAIWSSAKLGYCTPDPKYPTALQIRL